MEDDEKGTMIWTPLLHFKWQQGEDRLTGSHPAAQAAADPAVS